MKGGLKQVRNDMGGSWHWEPPLGLPQPCSGSALQHSLSAQAFHTATGSQAPVRSQRTRSATAWPHLSPSGGCGQSPPPYGTFAQGTSPHPAFHIWPTSSSPRCLSFVTRQFANQAHCKHQLPGGERRPQEIVGDAPTRDPFGFMRNPPRSRWLLDLGKRPSCTMTLRPVTSKIRKLTMRNGSPLWGHP